MLDSDHIVLVITQDHEAHCTGREEDHCVSTGSRTDREAWAARVPFCVLDEAFQRWIEDITSGIHRGGLDSEEIEAFLFYVLDEDAGGSGGVCRREDVGISGW